MTKHRKPSERLAYVKVDLARGASDSRLVGIVQPAAIEVHTEKANTWERRLNHEWIELANEKSGASRARLQRKFTSGIKTFWDILGEC